MQISVSEKGHRTAVVSFVVFAVAVDGGGSGVCIVMFIYFVEGAPGSTQNCFYVVLPTVV